MRKFTPALFFSACFLPLVLVCQTQTAISNFGTNPANINAYQYVPANMPANAPLVLVLHGCTQTASSNSI
jgi:poly(3-hydroxybutyrate) depolymerase